MRKTSARLVALGILTGTGSAVALEAAPAATARPQPPAEKTPSLEEAGAPGPADTSGSDTTPKNPSSPSPTEGPQAPATPPAPQGPSASPEAAPPPPPAGDREEQDPTVVPARDTVGGHLAVGAVVGLFVPFGSVDSSIAQREIIGSGLLLGGDITYGVSRTVMAGVYGEVAMPSGTGPWSGQNALAIAAGPMVRYHLVQGTRFDPWLSYGIGFRRLSNGNVSYTGIDWAHLELGGDWYAASNVGFGPLLELSMGTFLDSNRTLGSKAVNAEFVLGARLVFDGPGK
jgi:hypothetical protein